MMQIHCKLDPEYIFYGDVEHYFSAKIISEFLAKSIDGDNTYKIVRLIDQCCNKKNSVEVIYQDPRICQIFKMYEFELLKKTELRIKHRCEQFVIELVKLNNLASRPEFVQLANQFAEELGAEVFNKNPEFRLTQLFISDVAEFIENNRAKELKDWALKEIEQQFGCSIHSRSKRFTTTLGPRKWFLYGETMGIVDTAFRDAKLDTPHVVHVIFPIKYKAGRPSPSVIQECQLLMFLTKLKKCILITHYHNTIFYNTIVEFDQLIVDAALESMDAVFDDLTNLTYSKFEQMCDKFFNKMNSINQ